MMNLRNLILLAGAVALIAGVIGLLVPVSVTGDNGEKVGCGNGLVVDLSEARAANDRNLKDVPIIGELVPTTDYVAACQGAVSQRRTWSIPVAAVGVIAIVGGLLTGRRSGARTL